MAWYRDINRCFDPPGAMAVGAVPRSPSAAIGCLALYGLGTLAAGRSVGLLAAVLLMVNPLFRIHARRAMSDVPSESFVLARLLLALLSWKNLWNGRSLAVAWVEALLAGLSTGLARLAKLERATAPRW